jgi:hypothetical protein
VLVPDVAAEAVPVLVNNVATVKAIMAPEQMAAAMTAMPRLARRPRVWLLIFFRTPLCFLGA